MNKLLPYAFDLLIVIVAVLIVKGILSLFSIKVDTTIGIGIVVGLILFRMFQRKNQDHIV